MKHVKKMVALSCLLISSLVCADYGLHFDDKGQIIKPDQYYLWQGIDDEKDGFRDAAFENFKRSAAFGNYHAMSLVGLYYMQDKNYIAAHAWFKLIDLSKIPNAAYMEEIIGNLETMMSKDELKKANDMRYDLSEVYGSYPTMLKREEWKSNMKFTGTNIKGYIPPFLRIQLNSGLVVSGRDVKEQVEKFIYEYEFSFGQGEVILDEIEIIEVNEESEPKKEEN